MAFLKMATLEFPVSMCLGQGLYAELFLFSALNRLQTLRRKIAFQAETFKALFVCYAIWRKIARLQIFSDLQSCPVGLLLGYK